jgi:hypothetical protein
MEDLAMRKRLLKCVIIVVCLPFIFGGSCSDGDDNGNGVGPSNNTLNALAECTGDCMEHFAEILDDLMGVAQCVNTHFQYSRDGMTFNQITGDFTVAHDYNGDMINETFVFGNVPLIDSIHGDGLQPGESAALYWYRRLAPWNLTDSGGLSFHELSNSNFRITLIDETFILPGEACNLEFTSFGVHNDSIYVEDEPFVGVYTGVIEFITRKNSTTLTGMMTFDTTVVINVSGNYNGQSYEFTINRETWDVSM